MCMSNSYSWYNNSTSIDSADTIHQILAFGTLTDIKSLKNTLGEDAIKKLFVTYPKKIYTASTFNFIKKFILYISSSIDEQKYLKSTPRYTR